MGSLRLGQPRTATHLPEVIRLRVLSPLVVVNASTRPRGFVTIPVGSIIEIADRLHGPGMVRIRVGDEIFFALAQEIEKHTERLEGSTDA